jgi:cytochrome c-type biogenesis protein CcmE
VFFLSGITIVATLILYALQQNINLFYTPAELKNNTIRHSAKIRVGGMVQQGTLQQHGLVVSFIITDYKEKIAINYSGILPDLFREGQGIVALGRLNACGEFDAEQILAKHDENYMPPELKKLKDSNDT